MNELAQRADRDPLELHPAGLDDGRLAANLWAAAERSGLG